ADSPELARFFEQVTIAAGNAKAASNWVTGEVTRRLKADGVGIDAVGVTSEALGRLIRMIDSGTLSGSAAKGVFEKMSGTAKEAADIVEAEGLSQIGDENELQAVVGRVIAEHEDAVERFRAGNEGTLGFLVGQVMRATRGRANPKLVNTLLRRSLEG
ncbi:MAG: Asp-tRNA(Asn)/Glu-tRNA(Gln) amidotransferase GatCAB subunit B, partial [Acidobacteriota bacterium]|nr:Asp-tRNA(Asn)/Glu-tRNA(Gln) amidotransferase GatCAB subunit B [Acidobacteriota bacterium]